MARLVDLTRSITHRGPSTRTQPIPAIWTNTSHEQSRKVLKGRWSFSSMGLILSDHTGTHLDAFSHMDPSPDAKSIDQIDINLLYRKALCVDFSNLKANEFITRSLIEQSVTELGGVSDVDAVLYRTGHFPEGSENLAAYLEGFPGLSGDAVEWLVEQGIFLIGTEARSIDCAESEKADSPEICPAHQVCQQHQILVVENLFIPPALVGKRFSFLFLPLKIEGGTGGPGRAVAFISE